MTVQRRLGGLPLAVYVVGLLAFPLAAVGVFSVREVERNDESTSSANAVADAASIQAMASAVFVPLEIERSADLGLARVGELGVDLDTVIDATGIDLLGLRTSNAERLDGALASLATVLADPAQAAQIRTVADQIVELRVDLDDRSSSVGAATEVFDTAFAHLADVVASSGATIANATTSTPGTVSTVRRLELVIDVVATARQEMEGFTAIVLSDSATSATAMAAGGIRHGDALDAAASSYPSEIARLDSAHDALPTIPMAAFDGAVELDDDFTMVDVLQVADGLFAHVDYLELVAAFSAEQTELLREDVDTWAADAARRNRLTLLALGGVGLASLLFGVVVTRSFVRPLNLLRLQAERISAGELHAEPLVVEGPTDIRKVTGALNDMAGTLSLVEDHMDALAAAGVGHEFELRQLPGHVGTSMRTSMERITALTTRLQMSESRLAEEARIDNLTGLPNRFAVLEHIERILRTLPADTDVEVPSTGVMFLDVDGFKSVNDTHGHAVGDVVLRDIAQRLRGSIRDIDLVARLGGDEFLVIVADVSEPERLIAFGERMIEQIELPYRIGDQLFVVSASVGATHIERGDDSMSAIQRADAAVYQAKQRGRRRVEMFDVDLQRSIEHQAELELALRQAIQHDELRMYLQPLVDLSTGLPSGAEALVRWERPGVGLVPPGDFIPIAERSGLIFELERWMLDQACRRVAEWALMGRAEGLRLAVNISGRHLIEGDLVGDLDAAIAATGADPNLLEIELTESQLLDDVERASAVLNAVRDRGVKVAIDDFGTGYSSMTYLQKLPVDVVKIDRSFITSATTNDFDSTIIDTVVTIGRALALEIVAEGIETSEQLEYVTRAGVTQGQGFLLARPMPAHEAEAVIFGGPLVEVDRCWTMQLPAGPPVTVG